MRTYSISVVALALVASIIHTEPTIAQSGSAPKQAQALASPIRKILSESGDVTIERASAPVAQASAPGAAVTAAKTVAAATEGVVRQRCLDEADRVDPEPELARRRSTSSAQTPSSRKSCSSAWSPGLPTRDLVYRGDLVATGPDRKVSLVFADGTAFNVSSNARMELNEFVYNPNGMSNSSLFSLLKGTLAFVAGKIAKTGSMKLDTPVATMGIRGTTPHVVVSEDGTVKFSTLVEEKR